jgi:hypothetical protein
MKEERKEGRKEGGKETRVCGATMDAIALDFGEGRKGRMDRRKDGVSVAEMDGWW